MFIDGEVLLAQQSEVVRGKKGRLDSGDVMTDEERRQLIRKAVLVQESVGEFGASMTEITALMQERWEQQSKNRAVKRAQVAVGLRFAAFVRDGFACRYCGRSAADGAALEADHVQPRSRGGKDELGNLVTACWECNRGKAAKDIIDNLPIHLAR